MTLTTNAAWCMVDDPRSVEARFGLHDCHPTDSGGNRCSYLLPSWARDTHGRPRAGALVALADHILGELPYMRRPPGTWSLTAELSVDVVDQIPNTGVLFAEAQNVTSRAESFVECRITDQAGSLLAVGTTRCVYVPATADDPEPYVDAEANHLAESVGVEQALGIEYRRLDDRLQVTMSNPGNWVNGFGIMHGGVSACVTELVAAEAVRTQNADLSTARVHISYLRPVVADSPFVAIARPYHVGRSSAVVEVLGYGGGGRLCTVATVTARRHSIAD